MSRNTWLRVAQLIALVATGLSLTATYPAQADESSTHGMGSAKPLEVAIATTEQIQAMAAGGKGELLTLKADPSKGAGVNHDITCYLFAGNPYGGGAPDADVLADGLVYCDDWVHAASLTVDLYRDNTHVASQFASFPYVYGILATAGVANCTPGTYFGVATTVLARYDHYPYVIGGTRRSFDVQIGCGSPPPPPPPAGVTVANPGAQFNWQYDLISLEMTATGGTAPYTWTAIGLPSELSINASTGRISGTAIGAGTRTVTVTATAASGGSGSTSFTWEVRRDPCPTC